MLTLSSDKTSETVTGFNIILLGTCADTVPAGTTVRFIELDGEKRPIRILAQVIAEVGEFFMTIAKPVTCPTGQKRHFVFMIEVPINSPGGWYSQNTIGLSLEKMETDGTLVSGSFPMKSPLYNLRDGSVVQLMPERPPHVPTTASRR
jgi:hypothetical protein